MADNNDTAKLHEEILAFRESFQVAFLATSDTQNQAEASHAPFICDPESGRLYVFISGLAKHTQNLKVNPQTSVLLLENNADAPNHFALRRLQLNCRVQFLTHSDNRESIVDKFRERFGRFVDTLNSLGDFEIVELAPENGKYVKGFAQTFTLEGANLETISPVRPK